MKRGLMLSFPNNNYFAVKKKRWEGACIDTGAQTTVIGKRQAKEYCKYMGFKFKPKRSEQTYKFGDDLQKSVGTINIRIPIKHHRVIKLDVDVVDVNVPFLLGLDFLDKYKMYPNTVENKMVCPDLDINIPLVRKHGHIFIEWEEHHKVLFTKKELVKLHKNFSHPASDKLFNLLKLARPWETDDNTKALLEEIAKNCDTCQRFTSPPVRFKASLPTEEDLVFGDELSIDLMFLDGKAVLHIVDTATRFSAATFLDSHGEKYGQSVEGIWLAFVMTWATMYTGYPNRLRTDQGSVFTSQRWKQLTDLQGIQLRLSGVKAHSSLGIGERLHEPLRRIYNKISHHKPHVDKSYVLKVAVKAMNDTMGENGLVPSRLVFGIIPRFPILNTDLPNQKDLMELIKKAQAEMNNIIAERRVLAALTRDIPPAADRTYQLGEEVLVWSEEKKQWTGPFIVVDCTGRQVTIKTPDNSMRQMYSTFQIKPYYRDIQENLTFFSSKKNDKYDTYSVHLTEVIEPQDPRAWKFDEAKKKEIEGLIKRGTWKIVCRSEVPDDANILNGRFVLAIKDEGTDREIWKARFIVQGHRDRFKKSLVHDISVARQYAIKMLVGIASIFGFRLFSSDVIQSYIQSAEELSRDIFLNPPKEFCLGPDQLIKLVKPLYGLTESGDYWGRTLRNHLEKMLGMESCVSDSALFFKCFGGRINGVMRNICG